MGNQVYEIVSSPWYHRGFWKLFPVLFFVLLMGFFPGCTPQEKGEVHLVQLYSLRGALFPVDVDGVTQGGIGLAAGAIDSIRKQFPSDQIITVGTYNMTYGTPEAFVTDGLAIIEGMNDIGFQAMIVGPREFYFGLDTLELQAQRADFPFIAANLEFADGSAIPFLEPSFYHRRSGIGIIGLAPPSTLDQNIPEHVPGIRMTDPKEALIREVTNLQSLGAREIWVFAGGFGFFDTARPRGELFDLLNVPGIDLGVVSILPGAEPGYYPVPDSDLQILALDADRGTSGRAIDHFQSGTKDYVSLPITSSAYRPPEDLAKTLGDVYTMVQGLLNEPLARVQETIVHDFNAESPLGNVFTDLLREYLEVDGVLINSGAIRGQLNKGVLRVRDVYSSYPFGGNLVLFEAKGDMIRSMLQQSLTYIERPELGRGFFQVSGLEFSYTREGGQYVLLGDSIRISGQPLTEETYTLAVERFPFTGGDGYLVFQGIEPEEVFGRSTLSILLELIQQRAELSPVLDGRMNLLSPKGSGK